jgi:hypothetical protein
MPIIHLDPTAEGTGTQLTITTSPFGLTSLSMPAPPSKVQWASSVDTEGSAVASRGHENRTITISVDCTSDVSYRLLQTKIAKLHREGGTLHYEDRQGAPDVIIFDVLASDGFEPLFDEVNFLGLLWQVTFSLTCKPYGRGPEVDLGDNVETTLPALVFTEATVAGDVPALGRLVIDNDSVNNQFMLLWGLQSRYYSSAATAALYYEAEGRTGMNGAAAAAGPAGASGGGSNVMRDTALQTGPLAFLSTQATGGGAHMTHVGTFQVYARVQIPVTNTGTTSVSFQWGVGDASVSKTNAKRVIPAEGVWHLVDLGQINIPQSPVGTHQWIGYLLAESTVAADDLDVDYLMFIPVSEGAGEAWGYPGAIDFAIHPSQSAQLSHIGYRREDSTGTVWGPATAYYGDNLYIPPSGTEARTLRMIVKGVRGEVVRGSALGSSVGDANIDDISARLFVTPRYLVIPT